MDSLQKKTEEQEYIERQIFFELSGLKIAQAGPEFVNTVCFNPSTYSKLENSSNICSNEKMNEEQKGTEESLADTRQNNTNIS
mgnify:FL=1